MAGEAKSEVFMLGTATVMIGPMADVFDLTPLDHSVGLVKNVTITSEPSYTDLTQGVKNSIVYSVMTNNAVRASMEVYEYTSRNLAYSLGVEGGKLTPVEVATTISAATTSGATSITVTSATGITVGSWIVIGEGDNLVVRQVTAIATNALTVRAIPGVLLAGTRVRAASNIAVGSKANQPFFGVKIVGVDAGNRPITLILPKVRITNGFSLAFASDDYGNLPFELTLMDLVPTDALYAQFSDKQAMLFSTT